MVCPNCGNDKWYYNKGEDYLTCVCCKHEEPIDEEEEGDWIETFTNSR